jgi:hypothetical protein
VTSVPLFWPFAVTIAVLIKLAGVFGLSQVYVCDTPGWRTSVPKSFGQFTESSSETFMSISGSFQAFVTLIVNFAVSNILIF